MLVSGLCSFLGIYVGASVGFYGGLVTNILTPMDEVWAWLLSGGVIGAVSVALYFGQRLISVPGLGALGTLPMPIPPNEMAPRVLVGAIFGATVAGLAWLVSDEARPTHWLVLGGGIGAFLGARLWALLAREPRV